MFDLVMSYVVKHELFDLLRENFDSFINCQNYFNLFLQFLKRENFSINKIFQSFNDKHLIPFYQFTYEKNESDTEMLL